MLEWIPGLWPPLADTCNAWLRLAASEKWSATKNTKDKRFVCNRCLIVQKLKTHTDLNAKAAKLFLSFLKFHQKLVNFHLASSVSSNSAAFLKRFGENAKRAQITRFKLIILQLEEHVHMKNKLVPSKTMKAINENTIGYLREITLLTIRLPSLSLQFQPLFSSPWVPLQKTRLCLPTSRLAPCRRLICGWLVLLH